VEVSHVGLNDGVVEGLRCLDVPAFSVQYHPEAAAGPHDAGHLFDRFADLMLSFSPDHAIRADHANGVDHATASSQDRPGLHDRGGLHDHGEGVTGEEDA
jgi:carbamoyl-phosphate synthase small subunit